MSITITLRGRHYTVRSDEPEEDVVAVAQWVDRKVAEISRRTGGVSEETIALLACLNIANEYHRFRRKVLGEVAEIDRELQAVGEILEIMVPGASTNDEPDEDTEDGISHLTGPDDLLDLPDDDWPESAPGSQPAGEKK